MYYAADNLMTTTAKGFPHEVRVILPLLQVLVASSCCAAEQYFAMVPSHEVTVVLNKIE